MQASIFDRFLKPRFELREQIDRAISADTVTTVGMQRLLEMLLIEAGLSTELSIANATTGCDNGRTILQNLNEREAWRTAATLAHRYGIETLAVTYNERAEEIRVFINRANSIS